MTVRNLFAILRGNNRIQFNEETRNKYNLGNLALCRADFWHKFRRTELWNAEVDHISTYPIGSNIFNASVLVTIYIR